MLAALRTDIFKREKKKGKKRKEKALEKVGVAVEKSIKVEVRKCIYPILSRWDLASILK